jgi:deoxyhypusine synthase
LSREEFLREKLKSIEPRKRSVSELLMAMADTAFQGRSLGEAYKVLIDMLSDEETLIFLGLSGSMSTAGQWKLIKWLVENRYVDVVVSTGAIISEDIFEAMGFSYYKGTPYVDDERLLKLKIDRFYDTYADELQYREMESLITIYFIS